jgi:RNA-directed DNA polymerase
MRTLYVEGVATRDGPESCVGVRKGVGEALTGVRAGPVLSREIMEFGVSTLSNGAEGHTAGGAIAMPSVDPARSETRCMYGVSMRENREIPCPPGRLIAGRAAQARPRP